MASAITFELLSMVVDKTRAMFGFRRAIVPAGLLVHTDLQRYFDDMGVRHDFCFCLGVEAFLTCDPNYACRGQIILAAKLNHSQFVEWREAMSKIAPDVYFNESMIMPSDNYRIVAANSSASPQISVETKADIHLARVNGIMLECKDCHHEIEVAVCPKCFQPHVAGVKTCPHCRHKFELIKCGCGKLGYVGPTGCLHCGGHIGFGSHSDASPEPAVFQPKQVSRNWDGRSCPICKATFKTPVEPDERGHYFCPDCREEINFCPYCDVTIAASQLNDGENCPRCNKNMGDEECPFCREDIPCELDKCPKCGQGLENIDCPGCDDEIFKGHEKCPLCDEALSVCPYCGVAVLSSWIEDGQDCRHCDKSMGNEECPYCREDIPCELDKCPKCEHELEDIDCPGCEVTIFKGHEKCPECDEALADCPYCGKPILASWIDDSECCPDCGKSLGNEACPHCGEHIPCESETCPKCEEKLEDIDCPGCEEKIFKGYEKCPACDEVLADCPYCGKPILASWIDDGEECPNCNKCLSNDECPHCNEEIPCESETCPKCSQALESIDCPNEDCDRKFFKGMSKCPDCDEELAACPHCGAIILQNAIDNEEDCPKCGKPLAG